MDEHWQHLNQIERKLDAILTGIKILNDSINHLSQQLSGGVADAVAKLKASSDALQKAINSASEIQQFP